MNVQLAATDSWIPNKWMRLRVPELWNSRPDFKLKNKKEFQGSGKQTSAGTMMIIVFKVVAYCDSYPSQCSVPYILEVSTTW